MHDTSLRTLQQRGKGERRGPERRVRTLAVAIDRRTRGDRRVLPDRRRDTPALFSPEETARVREMVLKADVQFVCPRCGGSLTIGTQTAQAEGTVCEVRCSTCRRGAMLLDLP